MDVNVADNELMRLAGQGDLAAYRMLVGRHLNRSVRFAERMLGNRQDAEDVVQEAFLKSWHEAAKWEPRAQFTTWLYRVLYNACLNRLRKHIQFSNVDIDVLADTRDDAEKALIQRQRAQQVKTCLQQLPEKQRAAVILSYYEEVSDQQAADTLGLSLGALQQLLFRARQGLRHLLLEEKQEQKNGS
jgi:RNA polymerase sigma-70 factor (ECF subfamily)